MQPRICEVYLYLYPYLVGVPTFSSATIYRRAILGSIGQSIAEVENCSCHRDVISIGKLVRKNDGPKEVEQILATMTKYGEEW
jgi:hypothetical protein